MFCRRCGDRIADNEMFCSRCIAEEAATYDVNADWAGNNIVDFYDNFYLESKSLVLALGSEHKIVLDSDTALKMVTVGEFYGFAYELRDKFTDEYRKEIHGFESAYDEAFDKYMKSVIYQLECARQTLLKFEILDYDLQMLFDDFFEFINIEDILGDYFKAAEKFDEYLNNLYEIRTFERQNRSRWTGGGFGIKGAVMGSIKAGIMNGATDFFRDLNDAHIDEQDRKEINNIKTRLFKSQIPYITLRDALYNTCCKVGDFLYITLCKKLDTTYVKFKPSNQIIAKAQNASELLSANKISREKFISILSDCIKDNPYILRSYQFLYAMDHSMYDDIMNIAELVGVGGLVDESIETIDNMVLEKNGTK